LATEVDTVRLFRLNSDSEDTDTHHSMKNIASWTRIATHIEEREKFLKNENIPVEKKLISRLIRGETLILNASEILEYDPVKGGVSAKSIAVFPVFVDQKVWGVFWFADYLGERTWTGVEIDALLAA